jgi:hypothetical protein
MGPWAADKASGQEERPVFREVLRDRSALASVRRVAVFLFGEEPHLVSQWQEALSIEFQGMGWTVVPQEQIETALSQDYEKWWALLPDSVRKDPRLLEDQFLDARRNRPINMRDRAAVARLVGADAYLTGTLLPARHSYMNRDKASTEKFVVASFSMQVVSTKGPVLLEAILGYTYGKSVVFASQELRSLLEAAIR